MLLPATIGEDQPRPGRVAVHSMLDVFDHLSGRLELMAEGLEEGPRKPGHSGSPAKALAAESNTMTLIIILLDYKCRETSLTVRPLLVSTGQMADFSIVTPIRA